MAAETTTQQVTPQGEAKGKTMASAGSASAAEPGSAKHALLIIGLILGVVSMLIAAYSLGVMDPLLRSMTNGADKIDFTVASYAAGDEAVYEMPEILVNLDAPVGKQAFLKLKISLDLKSKDDLPRVDRLMPRILDQFTVYLSRMRIDEIRGGAGLHRVRAELVARVTDAVGSPVVNDVLFAEINIQ
jgi:flagellar FliL protein